MIYLGVMSFALRSVWDESLYILCLSVFLFLCLYLINVKTAEQIGPQFCVGPRMNQGKVSE